MNYPINDIDRVLSKKYNGGGVMDSSMKPFTAERCTGERHAFSLASSTFLKPMNFMGPNTNLDERLNDDLTPKNNLLLINKSDYNSMIHDIEYKKAKDNYLKNPTPANRKKQIENIWKADDKFINEMEHDREEPMAPIAAKLIQTKNY